MAPKTKEPELVLYPALSEVSREELEQHIEGVRARRMVAALEYVAGQNMRIAHESDKIQRKIKGQYESLGKEIAKLDVALEKVEKRLVDIEILKQELGLLSDQIEVPDADEAV